jgi:murein DD-endopeptidase MepM/ murein hydrolase activator NlpD
LIQSEINEKQASIEELNLQIEVLTTNIADNEKVIAKTESEIKELEVEAQRQLSNMYLNIKTNNTRINMIFADGNADIVKTGLYQKTIQDDTNSSLQQLQDKSAKLLADKTKLEEDKKNVTGDLDEINSEKTELDKKRKDLQAQVNKFSALFQEAQKNINNNQDAYKYLSDQEKALQVKVEQLKSTISNGVINVQNGQFVKAGTIIGHEGMSGVATGIHLHFGTRVNGVYVNPCSQLSAKQLMNTNCGVSNPSLDQWPLRGQIWLTSGYRTDARATHNAIDITTGGSHPIYAAHDGWVVYGNDNACSWYVGSFPCNGKGANYAIICANKTNCNSGLKTEYWHLLEAH